MKSSNSTGLFFRARHGRWNVSYSDAGKKVHVGNYLKKSDAEAAYAEAVKERNSRLVTPIDKVQGEVWAPATGFEGYEVSNLGRIKTLSFNRTGIESLMKTQVSNNGYERVAFGKKMLSVHRLVWEAFNGVIPDALQVNHKNRIKTDNTLGNLEVCDARGNQNHYQKSIGKKREGVWFSEGRESWVAVVLKDGSQWYLGCFDSEAEAKAVLEEHLSLAVY